MIDAGSVETRIWDKILAGSFAPSLALNMELGLQAVPQLALSAILQPDLEETVPHPPERQ